MAYNSDTQKIIAPVDMGDISTALGVDSLNLGTLCESEEVNKWSLRKSVRSHKLGEMTDDDFKAVKCGLIPKAVSKILAQSVGVATSTVYTKEECLAEVSEWEYAQPRGAEYGEYYRMLDFDGYNHLAVAPDSGWEQMTVSLDQLGTLMEVTVEETITGVYAGKNFKLTPKYNGAEYNGGLYSSFSIRLGYNSGEIIGGNPNMEIPIEYVASLDGCWRISLAVWIPNYGDDGGWVFFSSRMTVEQYFKEGTAGTQMGRQLCPDLATNPFGIRLMLDYLVTQGNYATFDVIPLLIKDLGNTKNDGVFSLEAVANVTQAYSMPSGASAVQFICGNPPAPIYFKVTYEVIGKVRVAFIENIDTQSHKFTYQYTKAYMGNIEAQGERSVTIAGGASLDVESYPNGSGYALNIKVIAQDDILV